MVIKLSGADFSANNIGQISVAELSVFTKAAIVASGNVNLTEEKQSALETFFSTVGAISNDGIWNKIKFAWLPMIAPDLSKSLVDYKTNIATLVPSSTYWEISDFGLKAKLQNASGKLSFNSSTLITGDNMSYVIKPMSNLGIGYILSLGADYLEKNYSSSISGGGDIQVTALTHEGVNLYATMSYIGSNSKSIGFTSSDSVKSVINGEVRNASWATSAPTYTLETGGTLKYRLLSNMSTNNATTYSPSGAIFIGDALTEAELIVLCNAIDALSDIIIA